LIEGEISMELHYTPLKGAETALREGRSNPRFVIFFNPQQALCRVELLQTIYSSMAVATEQD
jgi:hypothetical protein